jgi:polar amino acid transport system substrate-binding protein
MKFSSTITAVAVFVITLFTVASLGHAETIRLGMTPEPYMPFTQINQGGVWEGFEADLTNAVFEKMGIDHKISQMAWEGLIPSLTANKVDFIVGAFSITEQRRQVVDFSVPYYNAPSVFVGMKSDKTKISDKPAPDGKGMVVDAKGFSEKIIGVQNASIHAAYIAKCLSGADSKSYTAADNAVADLTAGRIDYVFMDLEYIKSFLNSKDGAAYEVKHEAPANVILGEGIAYAVRKGDKAALGKIDAALADLKKDGILDKMVQKWFFSSK